MTKQNEARLGYVPHFDVTTLDGRRVRYGDIWQRRNLVLVLVNPKEREAAARYGSQLDAQRAAFEEAETTVVVTADAVPELAARAVLIADRWGEILHLETRANTQVPQFPDIDELLSWVHFAEIQCPECPP